MKLQHKTVSIIFVLISLLASCASHRGLDDKKDSIRETMQSLHKRTESLNQSCISSQVNREPSSGQFCADLFKKTENPDVIDNSLVNFAKATLVSGDTISHFSSSPRNEFHSYYSQLEKESYVLNLVDKSGSVKKFMLYTRPNQLRVFQYKFVEDHQKFLYLNPDREIIVYDIKSKTEYNTKIMTQGMEYLEFTADGEFAIVSPYHVGDPYRLVNLHTGQQKDLMQPRQEFHYDFKNAMLSLDGKYLVIRAQYRLQYDFKKNESDTVIYSIEKQKVIAKFPGKADNNELLYKDNKMNIIVTNPINKSVEVFEIVITESWLWGAEAEFLKVSNRIAPLKPLLSPSAVYDRSVMEMIIQAPTKTIQFPVQELRSESEATYSVDVSSDSENRFAMITTLIPRRNVKNEFFRNQDFIIYDTIKKERIFEEHNIPENVKISYSKDLQYVVLAERLFETLSKVSIINTKTKSVIGHYTLDKNQLVTDIVIFLEKNEVFIRTQGHKGSWDKGYRISIPVNSSR